MNENTQQTFVEHLADLRSRLIKALMGISVGVGVGIWQSELLLHWMRAPILPYLGSTGGLVFTGVMDPFIAHIKIGAMGGLIVTCPWWLYQLWAFIAPGLYKKERKYAIGFIVSGTALFMAGVSFVYFVVYPAAFHYLLNVGGGIDKPMITIHEYLSFFATTTILFGVAFELPLILVMLALIGIIDAAFLKRSRRFAIPGLAFVSAMITPPDAISMVMMLVPLVFLYEIAIIVIQYMIPPPPQN